MCHQHSLASLLILPCSGRLLKGTYLHVFQAGAGSRRVYCIAPSDNHSGANYQHEWPELPIYEEQQNLSSDAEEINHRSKGDTLKTTIW